MFCSVKVAYVSPLHLCRSDICLYGHVIENHCSTATRNVVQELFDLVTIY